MTDISITDQHHGDAEVGDFFALMKPRVMSLAVFTAGAGLVVAPAPVHPVIAFASVLFIALGAGASGALNMWWDADIDAVMARTRTRPIPAGRIGRETALTCGLWLSGLSVAMLALTANLLAAGLLAASIFYYVVIYTMWLKRTTPQNIVIGGVAGAFPPVIGWAVATGSIGPEGVLMFVLVVIWTPPHFWSLALFTSGDYARAGVPMLPVTHGPERTRSSILFYTVALAPVSLLIAFTSIGGPAYLALAVVLNARFLAGAHRLWLRRSDDAEADGHAREKAFFRASLSYLFLLFAGLILEAACRAGGWTVAGWPVLF